MLYRIKHLHGFTVVSVCWRTTDRHETLPGKKLKHGCVRLSC